MVDAPAKNVTQLRIEVRHSPEGVTQAALQLPDTRWAVLLTTSTPAYVASAKVRTCVEALATAIVEQMVTEAVEAGPVEGAH